jgi:hypothetical protein
VDVQVAACPRRADVAGYPVTVHCVFGIGFDRTLTRTIPDIAPAARHTLLRSSGFPSIVVVRHNDG